MPDHSLAPHDHIDKTLCTVTTYTQDGLGIQFTESVNADCVIVNLLAGGEKRTTLMSAATFIRFRHGLHMLDVTLGD